MSYEWPRLYGNGPFVPIGETWEPNIEIEDMGVILCPLSWINRS